MVLRAFVCVFKEGIVLIKVFLDIYLQFIYVGYCEYDIESS